METDTTTYAASWYDVSYLHGAVELIQTGYTRSRFTNCGGCIL
jgi:hypothetical protein